MSREIEFYLDKEWKGSSFPLRDTDLHSNPTLGSAAGSGSKNGEESRLRVVTKGAQRVLAVMLVR